MSILRDATGVVIQGGTHIAAGTGSSVTVYCTSQAGASTAFKGLSEAVAHAALPDSAARDIAPRCHRNTRAKYRDQIERWMLGQSEQLAGKRLMWVHGGAGAGKSAIMRSVVEQCTPHGVILGAFFFSRCDQSRNYAEVLIPTLAYQVAQAFPEAMAVLDPYIQSNPLIFKASLHTQALELLVRPLLHLFNNGIMDSKSQLRRVFVIDGLDECSDPQKQALIIQIITSILGNLPLPICFLIASRPDLTITSAFEQEIELNNVMLAIPLHDDDDAKSDIRQFIEDSFRDIIDKHPNRHSIAFPWPPPHSIDNLVLKSSGLFIHAANDMRFISSPNGDPEHALEMLERKSRIETVPNISTTATPPNSGTFRQSQPSTTISPITITPGTPTSKMPKALSPSSAPLTDRRVITTRASTQASALARTGTAAKEKPEVRLQQYAQGQTQCYQAKSSLLEDEFKAAMISTSNVAYICNLAISGKNKVMKVDAACDRLVANAVDGTFKAMKGLVKVW